MTRRDDERDREPLLEVTTSAGAASRELAALVLRGDRTPGPVDIRAWRGAPVQVVKGVTAFEEIEFEGRLDGVGYGAAGRLVLDDPPSRYVTDSFTVRRLEGGHGLTAEGVRVVPMDAVISVVLGCFGVEAGYEEYDVSAHGGVKPEALELTERALGSVQRPEPDPELGAKLRRAGIGDEAALRAVARIYLASSLRGRPPAQWVATELGVSLGSASRWVAAAKDAGYLKTASRRRRD